MIKLIANITVERLQDKTTPTITQVSKTTPTFTNGSEKATPSQQPVIPNKAQRPINLSELRSRLQNAYRTPLPTISVSGHVIVM